MQLKFRQYTHKHYGLMAIFLSLIIVISGSLQLAHDQLVDHHHDSDCAMYAVDGNTPIANSSSDGIALKQQAEEQLYLPSTLVITQFNHHSPRAPPVFL
jgi:uncharacterized membrane protein